MVLIVTRPQHDITTRYLSCWAAEVISLARGKGMTVVDLVNDKANRNAFDGRAEKLRPRTIFFNGHGSADCVTGHDNEVLVRLGENHETLRGKITYVVSCDSGQRLGPKVVEHGDATYLGYSDEFIFVGDRNYVGKPSHDPRAKPFGEASNHVMISLLKGHCAREASERSKKIFRDYSVRLSSSMADPDALQAAQCLWWNMTHQVCLGDPEARL